MHRPSHRSQTKRRPPRGATTGLPTGLQRRARCALPSMRTLKNADSLSTSFNGFAHVCRVELSAPGLLRCSSACCEPTIPAPYLLFLRRYGEAWALASHGRLMLSAHPVRHCILTISPLVLVNSTLRLYGFETAADASAPNERLVVLLCQVGVHNELCSAARLPGWTAGLSNLDFVRASAGDPALSGEIQLVRSAAVSGVSRQRAQGARRGLATRAPPHGTPAVLARVHVNTQALSFTPSLSLLPGRLRSAAAGFYFHKRCHD